MQFHKIYKVNNHNRKLKSERIFNLEQLLELLQLNIFFEFLHSVTKCFLTNSYSKNYKSELIISKFQMNVLFFTFNINDSAATNALPRTCNVRALFELCCVCSFTLCFTLVT